MKAYISHKLNSLPSSYVQASFKDLNEHGKIKEIPFILKSKSNQYEIFLLRDTDIEKIRPWIEQGLCWIRKKVELEKNEQNPKTDATLRIDFAW